MDATDGGKLSEAVLNERQRRAVKMCLPGARHARIPIDFLKRLSRNALK
jgi:hypothetical protein